MNDDPMTEIRRLLIEGHGIRAAKVQPDARIVHDLGIDGDDASDLLHELHTRFGTDFAALEGCWTDYFNSEGPSLKAISLGIPMVIVCGAVGGLITGFMHWPRLAALVIAMLLIFGGSRLFARCFGKELRPLTVAGLAEIVEAGSWPSDLSKVR